MSVGPAKMMNALRRRLSYLDDQIARANGRDLGHAFAEARALRWALQKLEAVYPPEERAS